jgi:predicted  nucleic acid-binding Zn-ribbon protein
MRRKIPSEEQLTARNKIILSLEEVLKGRQEDLERIQNILRDRLTMVEDLDKKVAEFQNEMRAAEAMTRLHRDHYNY